MSGAGSIDRGTGIIVEPAEHDIRVVVRNTGDVGGSASLQLVHKGSPTAGEYIVTTISLGNIPALTTLKSNHYPMDGNNRRRPDTLRSCLW